MGNQTKALPDPGTEPAALTEAQIAERDGRFNLLLARFGELLSEDERDKLREKIERQVVLAATVRQSPLTNADEPDVRFVPFRSEGPA